MRALAAAVACTLLLAPAAYAQEVAITSSDSIQSVLAAQKGKRVTLRTRSGQEFTGVVRDLNPKVVVLGTLSSREFFDAVVPLEAVDAVLIRVK